MIGAFPARVEAIELAAIDGKANSGNISIFVVDGLEELVDRQELLRAKEAVTPPYWALVWIGARAIASYLLANAPAADARVLDLGCGLGLSGVAAGVGGARVTFADVAGPCLPFAAASAELAGLGDFETVELDFTRDTLPGRFDTILAADIVYEPEAYAPLAGFLEQHLAAGGRVLVTESLRADARDFLRLMAERGFSDSRLDCWVWEDGRRERTWLHTLWRHNPPCMPRK
jgi:predicted nicotinamide N-methyase